MDYCLDRIEDGEIAVMLDLSGKKTDVPLFRLKGGIHIGATYTLNENEYIYNEKQTSAHRKEGKELLNKLKQKKK